MLGDREGTPNFHRVRKLAAALGSEACMVACWGFAAAFYFSLVRVGFGCCAKLTAFAVLDVIVVVGA